MPLIIISGIPSSGKSTRAKELQEYFEQKSVKVILISETDAIEKAGFSKDTFYLDSQKEKHIRGVLKSDVQRLIDSDTIVIFDGSNYIKGYRYELYCVAKAVKCTQCTIHCEINIEEAFRLNQLRSNENEKYSRDTFDALVMRFESPDGQNRWDSPLFVVFPGDLLDFEAIHDCLFNKKPPMPNLSTQNAPLNSTNFLYELDKTTQEINQAILAALRLGFSENIRLPGVSRDLTMNCGGIGAAQLTQLRRQFMTYTKMHPADVNTIPNLYVQFLKSSII